MCKTIIKQWYFITLLVQNCASCIRVSLLYLWKQSCLLKLKHFITISLFWYLPHLERTVNLCIRIHTFTNCIYFGHVQENIAAGSKRCRIIASLSSCSQLRMLETSDLQACEIDILWKCHHSRNQFVVLWNRMME